MTLIKENDIPNFLPSFRTAYPEELNTIKIDKKDWDEYITALRQYTSAYCKLAEKIERK